MKKYLVALILVISFFISDTALACKPGGNWPPTPIQNVAQKDAVFIGTVSGVVQDRSVNGEYRVSFTVNETYKGNLGSTVIVKTNSSSAACGYDNGYDTFKTGSVWVIYATGNAVEGYTTNSISINTSHSSVAVATKAMAAAGVTAPKDESPVMCTMQYAPVCGRKDTGVRCITTPCPTYETKTYGNSCMLGADKAEYLYEGECKDDTTTPATVSPTSMVSAGSETDVSGEISVAPENTPAANVSVWQKIILNLKNILSFWK